MTSRLRGIPKCCYTKNQKEVTIKALNIIANILFWLFVTVELVLIILFFAPRLFNGDCYVVSSGSMEPDYPIGSLVYIEKVAPETIQTGDVVSFYLYDSVVATHEVYEIDTDAREFRTRGINNHDADGNILPDATPVSFDRYIGKAVYDLPYLGFVYLAIKNHLLLCLALAFSITFMLKLIAVKVKHSCVEDTTNARK